MKYIVGIDEAGRGPLAGPVAVGIVVVPKNVKHSVFNIFGELFISAGKIRDSKKLSQKKREEIFERIKGEARLGKLKYAVNFGSVKEIEKEGISRAIKKAMVRALKTLKVNPKEVTVLLDGSLKAPIEFKNQKTIIKGDEKETIIALASIVAKVLRDRKMTVLSKKYPKYNFDIHKGYGTAKHILYIKKFGRSPIHRLTYLKNILKK